jgi:hypothetical protein
MVRTKNEKQSSEILDIGPSIGDVATKVGLDPAAYHREESKSILS